MSKKIYVRAPRIEFVEIEVVEEASWDNEPFTVLQRKIEALMAITGGTEEQCERMVLEML